VVRLECSNKIFDILLGGYMRKYLTLIAGLLLCISSAHSFAQENTVATDSVELEIAQVISEAASLEDALASLLSPESDILSDTQKTALSALPEQAQLFFIETVASGVSAADAALTTASSQADISTDLGTDLYNAFAPQFANVEDEEDEGDLLQTAADGGASPVGFGTGAGGGGGGSATASTN